MLPFSLRVYRYATRALEPIAPLALERRARRGKELPDRLKERLGYSTRSRPDGELLWIHAASVGECLSVQGLIAALLAKPSRTVLLTSGTVTSAALMASRLPEHVIHQFVPVDTPAAVTRFLNHWRPDAAFFVDSEIWPNMLLGARARNIRLGLVNGRMSKRSYEGWRKAPGAAKALLSLYDICLVQDDDTGCRLSALGARSVTVTGSLKADAPPLPVEEDDYHRLSQALRNRKILLAASTHDGEEALILAAHDILRHDFPSLLTIIVPRHPDRGTELLALCGPRTARLRSQSKTVDADVEIYIADTMGELGLFYRLVPFAFVGGSLVPHGGQNPLEAVKLGAAVLSGPYTDNFALSYDTIFAAQGKGRISSADELCRLVRDLFQDSNALAHMRDAAGRAIGPLTGALERTRQAVENLLENHARA